MDSKKPTQFTLTPRSVKTTTVTTTVSTIEFPPLIIPQPAPHLDDKYYPLQATPAPASLKKFCLDIDGIPTYVKDNNNIMHSASTDPTIRKIPNLGSHSSDELPAHISPSNLVESSLVQHQLYFEDGSPPALPSPTLSPTLLSPANGGVLGMLSSIGTATSPLQPANVANVQADLVGIRNSFPQFGDSMDNLTSEADLRALPEIISTFDGLPQQLKSYLLLQLLRRCPLPTLQFISCLILPTLRRDFLGILPIELSTHILKYLDLRALGRCGQVSKLWKRVIEGPSSEISIWKFRLSIEGWLDPIEIGKSISRYDAAIRRQSFNYEASNVSAADANSSAMDSDEEFSLSHKNRVQKGKSSMLASIQSQSKLRRQPPNLYRNIYRRHHLIRLNWFQGKYRNISFPGHAFNVVTCLQFDADKIVSGSDDHTIHIYETETGTLRRKLEGHEGGVWALQYWKNVLVSGSTDRTVRVWDMETGKCRQKFDGHTSTVRCLMIVAPVMSEDTGKMEPEYPLIVTGSRDSTLRVWRLPDTKVDEPFNTEGALPTPDDIAHNPFFMHVLNGHSSSVRAIAGHGNVLISGSYDHTVRVWDLTKGSNTFCFQGHTEKVYSVGYSHELKRAASGSMDATVRVWCTKTGTALFTLKEGHSSLVGLLEFSSTYLVSAAADATLRVWSPTTGKCLATLTGHSAAITCFHHDPHLNKIVSGSDGGVKVWELSSAAYASRISPPITASGPGFAFTQGPNGPEHVNGRFIGNVVKGVQGVWRTRMDEQRLVCAVQKEGGQTWFEVLDFTEGVDMEDEYNSEGYYEDSAAGSSRTGILSDTASARVNESYTSVSEEDEN